MRLDPKCCHWPVTHKLKVARCFFSFYFHSGTEFKIRISLSLSGYIRKIWMMYWYIIVTYTIYRLVTDTYWWSDDKDNDKNLQSNLHLVLKSRNLNKPLKQHHLWVIVYPQTFLFLLQSYFHLPLTYFSLSVCSHDRQGSYPWLLINLIT